jgi:hypothetical protein
MSESPSERYGRRLIGGTVVGLAGLSVAAGVLRFGEVGIAVVGDVAVGLYIAGLALWGLFREGFDTHRFRAALYAGLVLWGTADLLGGAGSTVSFVILIGGSLLLAWEASGYVRRRHSPTDEP